jgi:hypothetical protein
MKYLYIILSLIFIAGLVACSKSEDLAQTNNTSTPPVAPSIARIDTVFTYMADITNPPYSKKEFSLPALTGIRNPALSVFFKINGVTNWIRLPTGFESFYNRNEDIITVFLWLANSPWGINLPVNVSVYIMADW